MGRLMNLEGLSSTYDALKIYADPDAANVEHSHWHQEFLTAERRLLCEPAIDQAHLMTKMTVWKNLVARPDAIDPEIHLRMFDQLIDEARALTARAA
ncbi:hypothetical protein ACLBXM_06470 [Xanthobacteraceae bacterium A53D]